MLADDDSPDQPAYTRIHFTLMPIGTLSRDYLSLCNDIPHFPPSFQNHNVFLICCLIYFDVFKYAYIIHVLHRDFIGQYQFTKFCHFCLV